MNHSIRFSRINHPRVTIWLLALVLVLAFGTAAEGEPVAVEMTASVASDLPAAIALER